MFVTYLIFILYIPYAENVVPEARISQLRDEYDAKPSRTSKD